MPPPLRLVVVRTTGLEMSGAGVPGEEEEPESEPREEDEDPVLLGAQRF